jgi:hypothetical protein
VRTLPSRSARAGVALAVLALVGTACVKQNKPGLAIKSLQSDIVFGINPPAATPNGATELDQGLTQGDLPLPTVSPAIPRPKPLPADCRVAGNADTPEAIATTGVANVPTEGVYRWRFGATQDVAGLKIPIQNVFLNRTVFDVSKPVTSTFPVGGDAITDPIVTKTFTYKVKTDLSVGGKGGYEVDTYQVKDHPIAEGVGTSTANIGKPIVLGDPERGVALKKTELFSPNGTLEGSFEPTPGLLLLPLSVTGGEEFESVGIDAANGSVTVVDGVVGNRELVDACGDVVDGWQVKTRQYFAGVDASDVNNPAHLLLTEYDYVVATQLGGILISEKVGKPPVDGIAVPSLPVLPELPHIIPGLPNDIVPPIPPLPVPLPTNQSSVEMTLASLHPTAAK